MCGIAILVAAVSASVAPKIDTHGLPLPLVCYGTEPFWSLELPNASRASFKSDIESVTLRIAGIDNAVQRPMTWRITFQDRGDHALIFDERPSCSDSDGDEPFPYGLLLERGGGLLRGCCRPKD